MSRENDSIFKLDKLLVKVGYPLATVANDVYAKKLDEIVFQRIYNGKMTKDECVYTIALFYYAVRPEDYFEDIFDACFFIYRYLLTGVHPKLYVKNTIFDTMKNICIRLKGRLLVPSSLAYFNSMMVSPEHYDNSKDILFLTSFMQGCNPKNLALASIYLASGRAVDKSDPVYIEIYQIRRFYATTFKEMKIYDYLKVNIPRVAKEEEPVILPFYIRADNGTDYTDQTYTYAAELGEGKFGVVNKIDVGNGRFLAMKGQNFPGSSPDARASALLELTIMSTYRHPNICSLKMFKIADHMSGKDKKYRLLTFMRLAERSFLSDILNSAWDGNAWYKIVIQGIARPNPLSHQQRESIGIQLCEALRYLHSHSILHLDVKPENIMLIPDPVYDDIGVKLIDFGNSIVLNGIVPSERPERTPRLGTPLYMAPEQLLFDRLKYSTKQDIWSLGCVIAEIEIGAVLFSYTEEIGEMLGIDFYKLDENFDGVIEVVCNILGTPSEQEWYGITQRKNNDVYPNTPNLAWLKNCTVTHMQIILRTLVMNPLGRSEAEDLLKCY